ncbi:SDR family NAD(P)-dependent oxidoreductase [Pimelobacter simplex]|uniref:SDR family NAD(P)-dependent oxidoreductase n=1 Tax=Nocardioides simplex TaxID=2045 RepID=UPI001931272E|nr:SDR family oxidoreductase [Pimelobacter simplex]
MSISSPSITDLLSLTGRTAIVTGGAMGIGRGIVERLAEAGASVVIADADLEAAETAAKELVEHGRSALAMYVDVGDADEVHRLVADTIGWRGRVDILVNNAGIFPNVPVLDMTPDDFDRVLRTNLRGVYLCSREAALRMRQQETGGRIINVTSIDALHPSSVGLAHYDASKHGVWGFTKNLALELAPHGIWVNAIAPGAIATPGVTAMQATGSGVDMKAVLKAFLAQVPMRRMGAPDDIARTALFLASDLASYITGAQIVVDGGRLLA